MGSHGSNRPGAARTTRRPVVLGHLVGALGLPGAARVARAASARPSVAVDFVGPGAARVEPASALASLTVYYLDGGAWTQRAERVGDGAAGCDLLGYSVATSGETVVVGALGDDDAGADAGAAYAFGR